MTKFKLLDEDTVLDRSRISTGQSVGVFGGSFSGKSTLLVNSLNNVVDDYDVIIFFTLSLQAQALDDLDPKIIVCAGLQPEIVSLANRINIKTGIRYRFLFIIDDVPNLHKDKTLEKMVLIYRNSGISTIFASQNFKAIPPAMRSSFHRIIVTGARTSESRDTLYQLYLKSYLSPFKKESRDKFIHKNTTLNPKKGEPSRYLLVDNIQDELFVVDRPKK